MLVYSLATLAQFSYTFIRVCFTWPVLVNISESSDKNCIYFAVDSGFLDYYYQATIVPTTLWSSVIMKSMMANPIVLLLSVLLFSMVLYMFNQKVCIKLNSLYFGWINDWFLLNRLFTWKPITEETEINPRVSKIPPHHNIPPPTEEHTTVPPRGQKVRK